MNPIVDLDKELFLLINGWHEPWLDEPMFLISKHLVWLPLYLLLVYVVIRSFKADSWIILIGIALTIVLADQISSTFMKPLVSRMRPTWDFQLSQLVHVVNEYRGGKFGFPSSHAANTFGVAVYLLLIFKKPWVYSLFAVSLLISYSRIYLGVHFPFDILAGWLVGTACAWAAYALSRSLLRYVQNKKTASR